MTIKVEQDLTGIARIHHRVRNIMTLLKSWGQYLVDQTQKNFRLGGRPVRWKPSLRAQVEGGQTLLDTGHLRRSIQFWARSSGTTGTVIVGSNLKYAPVHQYGAVIQAKNKPYLVFKSPTGAVVRKKSVTIPARPFLVILPFFARDLEKMAQEFLEVGK